MTDPNEPSASAGWPPPPPTPPSPPGGTFDFAKPFTFVFEDSDWLPKVLVGALFQLLGMFLIGTLFLLGYYARLIRNVVAGAERPLPAWDDLGTYFVEGLKLFCIALLYTVPIFGLVLLLVLPAVALEQVIGQEWVGAMAGCMIPLLVVPLALVTVVLLPAAMLRTVMLGRFSAAFEIGKVFGLVRACGFNYLLAIVIHLLAAFLSQFGILLCFVGVFATGFWALAVSAHAFAQAYRLAES